MATGRGSEVDPNYAAATERCAAASAALRRRAWFATPLAVVLALAFSLVGCTGAANLPEDAAVLSMSAEGLDPVAAVLLTEAQARAHARMGAAALGGGAGLLAGALSRRGTGGGGVTAAISGAAGGAGVVLGYAFGDYIAARSARATMDQQKVHLLEEALRRDAEGYERRLSLLRQVADETEAEVVLMSRDPTPTSQRRADLRQQARRTTVGAAVAGQQVQELRANLVVAGSDEQEINDVEVINRSPLNAAGFRQQLARLQTTRAGMAEQRQRFLALARGLPPEVRPVSPPLP